MALKEFIKQAVKPRPLGWEDVKSDVRNVHKEEPDCIVLYYSWW